MDFVHLLGYLGAGLMVVTLAMRTMVPLRSLAIISNILSIVYGFFAGVYPTLIQHSIQLPLNIYRLHEMLRLIRQVKAAVTSEQTMDWLKPFTSTRRAKAGDILFRKGDQADRMFFVLDGRLRLVEIDIDFTAGGIVGELGLLAPDRRRTQTLACVEDANLLQITYDRVEELCFQNPSFAFYFLKLSSARLFETIARQENMLAAREQEIRQLRLERATR
jgi:CRP/FNR family cyclic AMP-dependent transcriptional regulator